MDVLAQLKPRIEFLAWELQAAVQDYPMGEVDLYPTLKECRTLWRENMYEYPKTTGIQESALRGFEDFGGFPEWDLVYHVGLSFGAVDYPINLQQQSAWDIRVARSCIGPLLARDLNIRDCYHRESAEIRRVRFHLGCLAYHFGCCWWPDVDCEMIWTNKSTLESYHILLLQAYWKKELSTAGAVEGPDGAIYVRHTEFPPHVPQEPRLPIFVLYQQGSSSLTSTSASSPETTEESDAVGLQATEYEGQPEYIPPVPLGTSTSEYTATPMLTERFTENEVCRNTGPKCRGLSYIAFHRSFCLH